MLDWGNVPSWVGSVLTGSSLSLAAFTYFRNGADRRQAREDAERAQAARISLWWVNPRRAMVRNSNDVAVTVRAEISGDQGGDQASSERIGVAPGETRGLLLPAEYDGRPVTLALSMIDSYGRVWIRHDDGALTRVTTGSSADPRPPFRLRWEDR